MITLQELRKKINGRLDVGALPPRIIQSKFKIGFERPTFLLDDPTYLPFYFHLGRFMQGSKSLMEFGFDLGMPSGCFIEGAKSVDNFLAFRKKNNDYFTRRLGVSNIHNLLRKKFNLWIGNETDPEFMKVVFSRKWDCVIINDVNQEENTYKAYLELAWGQMSHGGVIVMDSMYVQSVRSAYESFCKSHNQEPFTITTLRGTGILQR